MDSQVGGSVSWGESFPTDLIIISNHRLDIAAAAAVKRPTHIGTVVLGMCRNRGSTNGLFW